jgi:hypothetical protein
VAIGSALNGWLYAITTYYDSIDTRPGFVLSRSIDTGYSWTVLNQGLFGGANERSYSNDIVIMNDSTQKLKIYWSGIDAGSPYYPGEGFVFVFDGVTGEFLGQPLFTNQDITGIAISSDYNYPASTSNPATLGLIYATTSVVSFHSSSNGGVSFDNHQQLATSSHYIHKVALNYGRSPSWSTGKFFAAWEEQDNGFSNLGHIYTSHSEGNVNSPFTAPVCLDSIDPGLINKVRNPSIACQFSSSDNNNGNLTEIVTCEALSQINNPYKIQGFYNTEAATSNNFNQFIVSSSANNMLQPCINFNPYNSMFMITYFDSTALQLPFLINDVNMGNPNGWTILNQAYNDDANLQKPNPKVGLSYIKQDGMNVWISQRTNFTGVSLFDSPYSTYTGINTPNLIPVITSVKTYPNPCNNFITVAFNLKDKSKITIGIYDLFGQLAGIETTHDYSTGNHEIINVAQLKFRTNLNMKTNDIQQILVILRLHFALI